MGLSSRIGDSAGPLSRLQRELVIFGIALLLGLVLMPIAIWLAGTLALGPYAGGRGVSALFGNFFAALESGAPSFWFVAVGPYVAIQLARLLWASLRGSRSEAAESAAPQAKRPPPPSVDPRRPPPQQQPRPQQPPPRRAPPPLEAQRRPPPQPQQPPQVSKPLQAPQPQQPPQASKPPQQPGGRRTPYIKLPD